MIICDSIVVYIIEIKELLPIIYINILHSFSVQG